VFDREEGVGWRRKENEEDDDHVEEGEAEMMTLIVEDWMICSRRDIDSPSSSIE
jgi:hypothetical protein